METRGDESIVVASILDDRFAGDKDYANRWSPVERTSDGKLEVGDPHPYSGSGPYLKATKLLETAGAVFVEYHIVFDEPEDWFNGANIYATKLPDSCPRPGPKISPPLVGGEELTTEH